MASHSEKVVSQFLKQEQTSKQIAKYVLRHAGKGKLGHVVETYDITEAPSLEDLDTLAHMILSRAQLDADGFGPRVQRYTITSYAGDEIVSSRASFRLKGAADLDIDGDDEAGEEAPSQVGLLSQLMRHNEFNSRNFAGSLGTLMGLVMRRAESQDRMVEKLLEDRLRTFEILEDARGHQAERDIMKLEEEGKQRRMDLLVNKSSLLLPVILDHMTKGKMPSKHDPMSLMVSELVGSLTIPQMEALRTQLSAEQQIVLFKVIQRFQEQKQLSNGASQEQTTVKKEN